MRGLPCVNGLSFDNALVNTTGLTLHQSRGDNDRIAREVHRATTEHVLQGEEVCANEVTDSHESGDDLALSTHG